MSRRNSGGIAPDLERIEAARIQAERLVDVMRRIPRIDWVLGEATLQVWTHNIDSLGGITSEELTV